MSGSIFGSIFSTLAQEKSRIDDAVYDRLERGIISTMVTEKSATEPDLVKVGPEGYIHGWIKVGPDHADVPLKGHAIQSIEHRLGKTRRETWHHAFHDGKHIGMVMPSASGKSFTAQPEMGNAKRFKNMKDALDHIAQKAGVPIPSDTNG